MHFQYEIVHFFLQKEVLGCESVKIKGFTQVIFLTVLIVVFQVSENTVKQTKNINFKQFMNLFIKTGLICYKINLCIFIEI